MMHGSKMGCESCKPSLHWHLQENAISDMVKGKCPYYVMEIQLSNNLRNLIVRRHLRPAFMEDEVGQAFTVDLQMSD